MKSIDSKTKPPAKEKAREDGGDIEVQSSDQNEIYSNEKLAEMVATAESLTGQQANELVAAVQERIKTSAGVIDVSPEEFAAASKKYGLDLKLLAVQNDLNEVVARMEDELQGVLDSTDREAEQKLLNPEEATGTAAMLARELRDVGMEGKVLPIEDGDEFSEAIIFENREEVPGKKVRIYRGINELDASIADQIPYGMRKETGMKKIGVLEEVRKEVERLAQNPTYENLLVYLDKVRPSLGANEQRRLDDDLAKIERGVLIGYSVRTELIYRNIGHLGTFAESGITPYISASHDAYEASGYGNAGILVIDIPISEIESTFAGSELEIKGALDKKYISAVLLRNRGERKDEEETRAQLGAAFKQMDEFIDADLYGAEELQAAREKKLAESKAVDMEQWKIDVDAIRRKRVDELAKIIKKV